MLLKRMLSVNNKTPVMLVEGERWGIKMTALVLTEMEKYGVCMKLGFRLCATGNGGLTCRAVSDVVRRYQKNMMFVELDKNAYHWGIVCPLWYANKMKEKFAADGVTYVEKGREESEIICWMENKYRNLELDDLCPCMVRVGCNEVIFYLRIVT